MKGIVFFALLMGSAVVYVGCNNNSSSSPAWPKTDYTYSLAMTIGTSGSSGAGKFGGGPCGVAVNAAGTSIYVADYTNSYIQVFDSNGNYQSRISDYSPYGLWISNDNYLYAASANGARVDKFTLAGAPVTSFYGSGFNPGSRIFSGPCGVVVDGNNTLWVADWNNQAIYKVNQNDVVLATSNGGATALGSTFSVATDKYGYVYAADYSNNRIVRYGTSLVYQTSFGIGGAGVTANGKFNYPDGIAIDGDNNLLVCDTGNTRVQKVLTGGPYVENDQVIVCFCPSLVRRDRFQQECLDFGYAKGYVYKFVKQ